MRKSIILIIILLFPVLLMGQMTTEWERCARTGAAAGAPDWFTAGYIRGIALSSDTIFVADRANSTIRAMSAADGTDLTLSTAFDLSQVAGGTYPMNDIETSEDGSIFLCNLVTDASASPFKIYVWNSTGGQPADTIKFNTAAAERLGDKFLVTGSVTDNSIEIWAPVSSIDPGKVYIITTGDQGATWDTTSITLTGAYVSLPANAAVAPVGSGEVDFYVTGNGANPRRHDTAGAYVANSLFNTSDFTSSRNGLRYFTDGSHEWLAIYTYRADGSAGTSNKTGQAVVYDVTDPAAPSTFVSSPLLGDDIDTYSSIHGECLVQDNEDGTFTIFVVDGVNGFGAYTTPLPTLEVSIYDIQHPTGDTGDSPYKGQVVTTTGIVTGVVAGNGFFMQDSAKAWNGIWVYNPDHTNAIGDEIKITGKIDEYFGLTEMLDVTNTVLLSTDNSLPEPVVLTTAACNEEAYESVVVQTSGACTNDSLGFGEWQIDDESGPVVVDDKFFAYTPVEGHPYLVTGPVNFSFDVFKIEPRNAGEVVDLSEITLPLFEGATDGTFDLSWDYNVGATPAGDSVFVIDSTGSAWGSHVIGYYNAENTGLIYVKDALFSDYTIEADVYLIGDPDPDAPLYTGIGIKMSDNDLAYYRLVFRNSSSSDHGQIRLQGYDGASWHISKYWNAGVDFDSLKTGWHKFRVTVVGNAFWAYMDGQLLSGCPYFDDAPFLTQGYPGMYMFNTPGGTIMFDNFLVTEPELPEAPEAEKLAPLWAQTQAAGTFPGYYSTGNVERGMAYGKVAGNDRVYVVSRTVSPRIIVHDAMTGDTVKTILFTEPTSAFFPINCVDVTEDGVIYVCNGIPFSLSAANPFKVYRYDDEDADPVTVLEYSAIAGRYGDMFSVYGRTDDNSVRIYAALKDDKRFIRFTTADNGMTFTPEVVTMSAGDGFGTNPNVAEMPDGTLYVMSYGKPLVHIQSDGTVIDSVAGEVVSTGASKIKYLQVDNMDLLMVYYANVSGESGFERFDIIDVTFGAKNAYRLAYSGSIGDIQNLNASGSVDYMPLGNDEYLFFIMGANNGLAAFTPSDEVVASNSDTLFYGDTPTLLDNPFGWGYIAGTNEYGDIGKYQRFDFKDGDIIKGFRYYFAEMTVVNDPDTLYMVVKTVGSNGAPDSTLASVMTTTDKVQTGTGGNYFFLDSPMQVDGPVFMGLEWSTTMDDTLALYSDADGEGDNANRAWEKFSDESYNDFQTGLNPDFSWAIDVDLWIAVYYKKAVVSSIMDELKSHIASTYVLSQNYPNPFNPTTRFRLQIPKQSDVSVVVYNVLGQRVEELFNGKLPAGSHEFVFEGQRYASGVYFYRVQAGSFTDIKKMILVK